MGENRLKTSGSAAPLCGKPSAFRSEPSDYWILLALFPERRSFSASRKAGRRSRRDASAFQADSKGRRPSFPGPLPPGPMPPHGLRARRGGQIPKRPASSASKLRYARRRSVRALPAAPDAAGTQSFGRGGAKGPRVAPKEFRPTKLMSRPRSFPEFPEGFFPSG